MKRMSWTLAWDILQNGLCKGVLSLLRLAKFVLPTVFVLTLLQHTELFDKMAQWLGPFTAPLGLPGNAALALLTGLLINKFAGIAGLLLVPLNSAQFYTAALFLALAHNLILEVLIVWQSRLPVVPIALLRAGIAYLASMLAHAVLQMTGWLAQSPSFFHTLLASSVPITSLWEAAAWQALHALLIIAIYLIPLFIFMEALQQFHLMTRLERISAPLTASLRLSPGLTTALLSGLLLGVATGAGVIEQSLQEQKPARLELWRLNVFLLLFHSLFEDTLMFAILPVPILAVAGVRFLVAWVACRLLPARLVLKSASHG